MKQVTSVLEFANAAALDRIIFDRLKIHETAEKETAKKILDEVSKHYGGAWLVELCKKYDVEVE